jgi:Mor family transcriptional regulator
MKVDNRIGELNKKAKLTAKDVRAIRRLREPSQGTGSRPAKKPRASVAELAARYGVTEANITAIVNRYTWKHL